MNHLRKVLFFFQFGHQIYKIDDDDDEAYVNVMMMFI